MSSWRKMRKRAHAMLLVCAMLLSLCMTDFVVRAEETPTGLCVHHMEHNEECGYMQRQAGTDCTHTHDDICGYVQATEDTPCTHVHDEVCSYVEGQDGNPCTHVHDETCGYAEANEGTARKYVEEGCAFCVIGWTWNAPDQLNQGPDG